jgi:peptidylprolyl isomerase
MSDKEETKPVEDKVEEEKKETTTSTEAKEEKPTEEKAEVKEEKEPEEERIEGAVNRGDFIVVELTGLAEETGEVFDTTSEETAKEQGTYDEKRTYGPRLVVAGEGWVLKGLDTRLRGLKVGEEQKIEIPAAEAFGERDAENVQTIPFRVLRSKGVNPALGAELEIDGRSAVVRSIGAGRVQVDYNPRLAGRKIVYTVKVAELIEDEKAKFRALIKRRFPGVDAEKFGLKKTKKRLHIEVPEEVFFGENVQIAKRALANDILRFFKNLDEVEFGEVVKRS